MANNYKALRTPRDQGYNAKCAFWLRLNRAGNVKAPQVVPEHVGGTREGRFPGKDGNNGRRDPGVAEDGLQSKSVPWPEPQTGEDE